MELLEDVHRNDGVTILLVTHDLTLASQAQSMIHILDGQIKEIRTLKEEAK